MEKQVSSGQPRSLGLNDFQRKAVPHPSSSAGCGGGRLPSCLTPWESLTSYAQATGDKGPHVCLSTEEVLTSHVQVVSEVRPWHDVKHTCCPAYRISYLGRNHHFLRSIKDRFFHFQTAGRQNINLRHLYHRKEPEGKLYP